MVAWAFPNDRKLQAVPKLMDRSWLTDHLLPPIVESRWGADWQIASVVPTPAHFVPEYSCCVRVQIEIVHRDTNETKSWLVFAKTYYNGQGSDAFENMQMLWDSASRTDGDLHMARPLGYQPDERIFWQEGVEGSTLLAIAGNGIMEPHLAVQTARGLAALHGAGVDCPGTIELDDWVSQLDGIGALVAEVRPSCAAQMAKLVQRLHDRAPDLSACGPAIVHGDFHPKNLIVQFGRVSLIDLDDIRRGPPLMDIGSFIATHLYRALLDRKPPMVAAWSLRPFLETYRERVRWPATVEDVAWYTATALVVERAYRSVTRLKGGNLEILDRVIELADDISRLEGAWPEIFDHG